mmetsp:Transcript_12534/g.24993  ORF Transcript_12534/g.24993 Transcript_12534/m.24993 type:complete len:82 (+) Transcript_12534:708-953(+)
MGGVYSLEIGCHVFDSTTATPQSKLPKGPPKRLYGRGVFEGAGQRCQDFCPPKSTKMVQKYAAEILIWKESRNIVRKQSFG